MCLCRSGLEQKEVRLEFEDKKKEKFRIFFFKFCSLKKKNKIKRIMQITYLDPTVIDHLFGRISTLDVNIQHH